MLNSVSRKRWQKTQLWRLYKTQDVSEWASETERVFISPGQPWRNGFFESFNGKLRDKYLSINQFYSLNHAKGIIGLWKEEYNTIRPHSSLGNKTPRVYAGQCTH